MSFKQVKIEDLQLNPWQTIGQDWLLVTAGDEQKANTMTASWGGLGVLWHENVAFVDAQPRFSLSFFEGRKKELSLLGSVSGRERDKIAEAGLHLTFLDGVPTFEEARLVLLVQKLYADELRPQGFILPELDGKNYAQQDYHTMYVAKIEKVYLSE